MHEGEKPGLSGKIDRESQETVELDRDQGEERPSTADRDQPSARGGDLATRSKA